MIETPEERRRRMMEAMAGSLQPNQPLPPPSPVNVPADASATAEGPLPQAPPIRIGYSTAGLTGVDKLMERRKAFEEADPQSKVNITPDFAEIEPPNQRKGFKGRLKSFGEAALAGLAMSDPDNPTQGLGAAIGGGLTGAVSPRGGAKLTRRFEMNQLDNDIARGLQLEHAGQQGRGRGPLGEMSTRVLGEGEYEGMDAGTEVRVRIDPRTGTVTDVVGPDRRPVVSDVPKKASAGAPHYEKDAEGYLITVSNGVADRVKDRGGQPIRVKATDESGEVVEVEVDGKVLKVTPGQALNYYGQIGKQEDKGLAEAAKRTAKLNEASSLYKKAEAMDSNAAALEEHIAKLEAGKASFSQGGNVPLPDEIKPFDEQIKELRQQQQKLKSDANDLRTKGDAARAEGESIPKTTTTKAAGRTWSALKWAAANPNGDVNTAKAQARRQGLTVID